MGDSVVVNVGKGFERDCGKLLSQTIAEEIPHNPIVTLTGPCHAEEVGRGVPTTVVAAGRDSAAVDSVRAAFQSSCFRIYRNDDTAGCELGGALKNPIALCCGIVAGMGLGDNTAAALMTRGLAEITRLGVEMGAKWQTFTGLAGMGDLIVTCMSRHSRNHRAGILIGQGVPADEAVKRVGTVEGYEAARIALKLAREKGVDVPIIEQLCRVCYENVPAAAAVKALMERPGRDEREDYWDCF